MVDDGTKLANKRVLIAAEPGGTPDGFRFDTDGNLWCGWGMGNAQQDGVKVFDPTGSRSASSPCPSAAPMCASAA